jgi:serine/threonine protein phosphatase PrpC
MIELDIGQAASIGARSEQQDAAGSLQLGTGEGAALLVLADGLGGHADGALASKIVIETFGLAASGGRFDEPGTRRHALHEAIQEVNRRIHSATDPMDGHRSMASTAVACILANGTVRWISVGDSHLYVCRNGRLSKLNADHSQAGIMIRHGYSPTDEAVMNARSVLVSALTGREIEEIDNPAHDVALEVGDVVLLASDGLNTLSDTDIALVIDQTYEMGAQAICTKLIQRVLEQGLPRQDNVTVVAARVLGYGARRATNADEPSLPLTQATTRTDIPTTPFEATEAARESAMAPPPPAEAGEAASAPGPGLSGMPDPAPFSEPITAAIMTPPEAAVTEVPGSTPHAARDVPQAAPEASKPKPALHPDQARRRLMLKILATAAAAAAIASVIVTQTL